MIQLNMFEKLPPDVLQSEWMKEHIKNPPPVNVSEQQKQKAQQRIAEIKKLNQPVKINLS